MAYAEQQKPEQLLRDRCTLNAALAEEYRLEMQRKIDAAEAAARQTEEVEIRVSRQTYRDLVEAYRFLRQVNPWYKSVGQRLEKLGVAIRDALDKRNAPMN